jgi:serine/threonine-protein kinase
MTVNERVLRLESCTPRSDVSELISAAEIPSASDEHQGAYRRGQVLRDKYELLRPLDSGGMGVVWVARDHVLNVEVALKLIERPVAERQEFTRRALSEARLAAKLAHPAVCRAMDFGLSESGDPFVVSELLTGESLEDRIEREGSMHAVESVQMLLPILDALASAHELGIVHRDVKPANIFLAKQWSQGVQPKLLDFGIARWVDESEAGFVGICGTPYYMSPEQARASDDIDGRSDIWNFCATLYETITGVPPFDGETTHDVILALQSVDPLPITSFGSGDDELSSLIARGMQRDRAERWATANELAVALARWLLSRGAETDGSGHSLRARLGESHAGQAESRSVSPVALSSSDVRPGPRPEQMRRFWMGMVAGALVVLPLSFFQVLRAAHGNEAAPRDGLHAAPATPPISPERLPTAVQTEAPTPEVEPAPAELATEPPSFAVATPSTPRVRASQSGADPRAPVLPVSTSTPRWEPKPTTSAPRDEKKSKTNALGYDFGF